jgi:predicted homoserine dehydrogenase-like protein
MLIIDDALAKRARDGNPIRVAIVGAGYSGKNIAYQILTAFSGIRLVGISNRTIAAAVDAYSRGGVPSVKTVETVRQAEEAINRGEFSVTDDAMLLCEADGVDAIIDATGEIEFGCRVAMKAIECGKHIVLMNAELDATLGPILNSYAVNAGVIFTNTDGDEPGVAMNLYRYVKTIGLTPVLAGNLKGYYDPYRTPDTQREFAKNHNQKPRMMTSFVDGTKLSMEIAVLANATGLHVGKRGMFGPRCAHVKDAVKLFPLDQLLNGGLVDYLLGAEPGTGAFVIGFSENSVKQQYLKYLKMGDGPLYVFYTPYHLPHLEIPITVARAVLFRDATVSPKGAPVCEVLAMAKRDLKKGETLDGIGGFTCYGLLENSLVCRSEGLLPMGLADGCFVKNDIFKDKAIALTDVEVPEGRMCDILWKEQNNRFFTKSSPK